MNLTGSNFNKARNFVLSNARIIERRLFRFHFNDGTKEGIFHAVLAYQNPDCGFGHGLEPDTSSPESQPLFTQMALDILDEIDCFEKAVINRVLEYLVSITTDSGGVPWMLNPASNYPRAFHFDLVDELPAIHPTAPILGLLIKHRVEHPWMKKAEQFCWDGIAASIEAKCSDWFLRHIVFLEQRMDDPRAEVEIAKIKERILAPGIISFDPSQENIGLHGNPSPLNYAPTPDSGLRPVFSDEQVERDLDRLIVQQHEDGGWATSYGISPGTRLEWDGMYTLNVLKILKAYGRIEHVSS